MTTNVSPAVLQSGATLTTVAAAYVTCAANVQTILKRTVFTNVAAGAVTFTVYRVLNAGAPTTANEIIVARSIAAGGTDLAPELTNMVLNPGDTIQCLASANTSINVFSSGFVAS